MPETAYKFTFEDGSEAIMHYGVKGMKWRKHKVQEEGYQIDPDKFGYENTEAGRLAAYRESGLNSHMSREQAARYMAKSNAKWEHEKKQMGVKLNKHGIERNKKNRKLDRYLVKSLPTRKAKQKSERKAALKRRLEQARG